MRAEEFILSNGLKVVHLELPGAQNFRLHLHVPVGSAHDPSGIKGLSHILEHTVLCGTSEMSEEEFEHAIASMGGSSNAATGNNSTEFDFNASSYNQDHYVQLADLLRQTLTKPAFDPERVEIEKNVILNEKSGGQDSPLRFCSVELYKNSYNGRGVAPDNIGSYEEIRSVTRENLIELMSHYDAGHMVLYSAGPISKDRVIEALEQTVSSIPGKDSPPLALHQISHGLYDGRVFRPGLMQNYTTFLFIGPLAKTPVEIAIEWEAQKQLAVNIPKTLRRKYGCFYSPEFSAWDSDNRTQTNVFMMSNLPEFGEPSCRGLINFFNSIDEIITDESIQGSVKGSLHVFSDPSKIDTWIVPLMKQTHQNCGLLFDVDETNHALRAMLPQDVRRKAKEVLSSLTGMYVIGAKPDAILSLETMREGLRLNGFPSPEISRQVDIGRPKFDFPP